jgi:hypothetical protein
VRRGRRMVVVSFILIGENVKESKMLWVLAIIALLNGTVGKR